MKHASDDVIAATKRIYQQAFRSRDCLITHLTPETNGYVRIRVGTTKDGTRRRLLVHRAVYEFHYGPIQDGLEIDHLCRTRGCVEISHLEAVTFTENQRRSNSVSGLNSRKTHCAKGHPYTDDNTLYTKQGPTKNSDRRRCRICEREWARKRYAADPERYRTETRERYAADPERYRAETRERYAADPERYRAEARAQYAADPEKFRARTRAYRDRLK